MWMYHSHTNEVFDTNAGLIGPMLITARGMARPDGSPKDVDRELVTLFSITNENESPYLQENLKRFAKPASSQQNDQRLAGINEPHGVNGYIFGNEPMITMRKGQHVRWYVMSMGSETDLHTPHWHGNDVVVGGMRMDTVGVLPGTMAVADMVPDNVGIWLYHCHVNDHILAGMITRYRVVSDTTALDGSATTMPVPVGGVPAGEGGVAGSRSSFPVVPAVAVVAMALVSRSMIARRRRALLPGR